jgi:hypothetical protein
MVIVVCSDLDQAGRRSGFRAAVKVVRSIASNDATAPIVDASGRFKDIISEKLPISQTEQAQWHVFVETPDERSRAAQHMKAVARIVDPDR